MHKHHQARKRFGQHFLTDSNILHKIIAAIHPKQQQHIIEIGPGQGALTHDLAEHCQHLDVIEIDRDLVAFLRDEFKDINNITIHEHDVLSFDFAMLCSEQHKVRVVGNLPYNISTPLLFKLFEYVNYVQDMFFLLQKEVVNRLCAPVNSKDYNRLSVMTQYFCQTTALFDVPPQCFTPPPKVDSAVVCLTPTIQTTPVNDLETFSKLVKQAFNYRRKMLSNSLKDWVTAEQFAQANISSNARPQELSVSDYINLANLLS